MSKYQGMTPDEIGAARRIEFFVGRSCMCLGCIHHDGLCKSTEKLQLDHIDPKLKDPMLKDGNGNGRIWKWGESRRNAELTKCQVLCKICHDEKSKLEKSSGSSHLRAKLNEEDVRIIKQLAVSGISGADLGRSFGVTKEAIYAILKGRNWKDLK